MFLTLGLTSLQVFSHIPRLMGYSGYNGFPSPVPGDKWHQRGIGDVFERC